jgi:ABC-type proline/glycine betaine transport system permease subunit
MRGNLSIGDRAFRAAVVAILGAGAAFVLMLSVDFWRRPYEASSLLLPAALIGGVVGGILGFVLTDADWVDLFRKP